MKKPLVTALILGSILAVGLGAYGTRYYAQTQIHNIHSMQNDFEAALQAGRAEQAQALLEELDKNIKALHKDALTQFYMELSPPQEKIWSARHVQSLQEDSQKMASLKPAEVLLALSEFELKQLKENQAIAHSFADTELYNNYALKFLGDYYNTHHDEILTQKVKADSQLYASIQASTTLPTPKPKPSEEDEAKKPEPTDNTTDYTKPFETAIEEAKKGKEKGPLINNYMALARAHLEHGRPQEADKTLIQAKDILGQTTAAHEITAQEASDLRTKILSMQVEVAEWEATPSN